jgi:predicted dehydrogenase
MRPLL